MDLKLHAITDFLNEQTWFQQLKAKWEELDPQSRFYLKIAGLAAAVLLVLYLLISSIWSVHKLKHELSDKNELLMVIQNANEEIRRLHEGGGGAPQAPAGAWNTYFENLANQAGIDKPSMTVSAEKPGSSGEIAKESLFDLSLKKVTTRQVVKLAYFLETGNQPVKLRNISLDTDAEHDGYLDATLAVSAFTLNEGKK